MGRFRCGILDLVLLGLCLHAAEAGIRVITENPSQFAAADPLAPKYVVAMFEDREKVPTLGAPKAPMREMEMTDHDGQRYTCRIPLQRSITGPTSSQQQSGGSPGSSAVAPASPQEANAQKSPFERLELLSATPCLYIHDGQWTYESCYKRHVRQFRQEGSGKAEDFMCGEYLGDEKQDEAILEDASASGQLIKYVSHKFGKGSRCLLTGEPRTAEVRYTCKRDASENQVLSAREFPTCNYVVVVASPFLCEHPDFKPTVDDQRLISCVLQDTKKEEKEEEEQQKQNLVGSKHNTAESVATDEGPETRPGDAAASEEVQAASTQGSQTKRDGDKQKREGNGAG